MVKTFDCDLYMNQCGCLPSGDCHWVPYYFLTQHNLSHTVVLIWKFENKVACRLNYCLWCSFSWYYCLSTPFPFIISFLLIVSD